MPLAGFYSTAGRINFWAVNIAGTIGAHLGSLGWYWLRRHFEKERFERLVKRHGIWLGLEPRHIQKATRWFEPHGSVAVLRSRRGFIRSHSQSSGICSLGGCSAWCGCR